MPLVKVFLRKGKPPEYLRLLSDAIHAALVSEAGIPEDDKFHLLLEMDPDHLFAHPSYGDVERSDDLVVVEITLNAGRNIDVKKAIYRRIARNLERDVELRPDDLLVSLIEVAPENWSFGKGLATYG
jgi:phenylpyruvate tautomerase PptA (4-oxalocrotonate tautomerase family)